MGPTNFGVGKMLPIEIASDLNLFDNLPQNIYNPPPTRISQKKLWHKPFSANILHIHKKKNKNRKKDMSWISWINPFECESDYDDGGESGDDDD